MGISCEQSAFGGEERRRSLCLHRLRRGKDSQTVEQTASSSSNANSNKSLVDDRSAPGLLLPRRLSGRSANQSDWSVYVQYVEYARYKLYTMALSWSPAGLISSEQNDWQLLGCHVHDRRLLTETTCQSGTHRPPPCVLLRVTPVNRYTKHNARLRLPRRNTEWALGLWVFL